MADESAYNFRFHHYDYPNNCGMGIIGGFSDNWDEKTWNPEYKWWNYTTHYRDGPLSDDEWLRLIWGDSENPGYSGIYSFSGAEWQKNKFCSAYNLAKWLREKGETVVCTPEVRNPNSGEKIQAFYWSPSSRFKRKYRKLK
jgi:hypothetical protein